MNQSRATLESRAEGTAASARWKALTGLDLRHRGLRLPRAYLRKSRAADAYASAISRVNFA